ncbi:hypothetical protein D9M70_559270 [compost metagenome]
MELLGDVEAGAAALDHGNDALQVPFGALQPLDDLGMGIVSVFVHARNLSPWRGYIKGCLRR